MLLLIPSLANAAWYYVSPTGTGTACGVPAGGAAPPARCSFQDGLNLAQPGDSVIMMDGTYTGTWQSARAGTTSNKITIRAQNALGADITSPGNTNSVLFDIRHSYITLKDVDFNGASHNQQAAIRIRAEAPDTGEIDGVVVESCRVVNAGNAAIQVQSANNFVVRLNTITGTGKYSVASGTKTFPGEGILLSRTGGGWRARNGEIYSNVMTDINGECFDLKDDTDAIDIHHNRCEAQNDDGASDSEDIMGFFSSQAASNVELHDNIFEDGNNLSSGDTLPAMLFFYSGSQNVTVANNVFYNLDSNKVVAANACCSTNIVIRDNTFCGLNTYQPGSFADTVAEGFTLSGNSGFLPDTACGVVSTDCDAEVTRIEAYSPLTGLDDVGYGPSQESCVTTVQGSNDGVVVVPDGIADLSTAVEGQTNKTILIKSGAYSVPDLVPGASNTILPYNCAPVTVTMGGSAGVDNTITTDGWTIGGIEFDCQGIGRECFRLCNASNVTMRNNSFRSVARGAPMVTCNSDNVSITGNVIEACPSCVQEDMIWVGDISDPGGVGCSGSPCRYANSPSNVEIDGNHLVGNELNASTAGGKHMINVSGYNKLGLTITNNLFSAINNFASAVNFENNWLRPGNALNGSAEVAYNSIQGPFNGYAFTTGPASPAFMLQDAAACLTGNDCPKHRIHHNYGANVYSGTTSTSGQNAAGIIRADAAAYSSVEFDHNIDHNARTYADVASEAMIDWGMDHNTFFSGTLKFQNEACLTTGSGGGTADDGDYFVNDATGVDTNNGTSPSTPFKTVQKGLNTVGPGQTLVIYPGTYYEIIDMNTKASTASSPITVRASERGAVKITAAWKEAAQGSVTWTSVGSGTYSAARSVPALWGYWINQGTYLHRFNTQASLSATTVATEPRASWPDTMGKPTYGFAPTLSTVYVRLPAGANPNGQQIMLGTGSYLDTQGQNDLFDIFSVPYLTIDGLVFEGSGTRCIDADAASHHLTVKYTKFQFCKDGVRTQNDAVVEWSESTVPGLNNFATDVYAANDNNRQWVYQLFKQLYQASTIITHNGADNLQEGSMVVCQGASARLNFRYNWLHEGFDHLRIGGFSNSDIHHNVFTNSYDNVVEFEDDSCGTSAQNLRFYKNKIYSPGNPPFSHQATSIQGPHYVYRNVVHYFEGPPKGQQTLNQPFIKLDLPASTAGIFYYQNLFYGNGSAGIIATEVAGRDQVRFRNNIFRFQNDQSASFAYTSDHNILINNVDKSFIRGASSIYASAETGLNWIDTSTPTLDFGITTGSIAQNAGTVFSDNVPELSDGVVGTPDIGPFEVGQASGVDWPRAASSVMPPYATASQSGTALTMTNNVMFSTNLVDGCSNAAGFEINDNNFSNIVGGGFQAQNLGTGNTTTSSALASTSVTAPDFTITTASVSAKGALPVPVVASASINTAGLLSIVMTPYSNATYNHGPLSAIDTLKMTVRYNTVARTISSATLSTNTINIQMPEGPVSTDTVTFSGTYGWCEDSAGIGGTAMNMNARCLAVTDLAVTNASTGGPVAGKRYVDASCTVQGNGTTQTCGATGPWMSLKYGVETAACSGMVAGDIIEIKGNAAYSDAGEWYLGGNKFYLDSEISPAAACSGIIIQNGPGQHVVFDGTLDYRLKTWTSVGSGVYECTGTACGTAGNFPFTGWYRIGSGAEERLNLLQSVTTCTSSLAAGYMSFNPTTDRVCVHLSTGVSPSTTNYIRFPVKATAVTLYVNQPDNMNFRKNPAGTGSFMFTRYRDRLLLLDPSKNTATTINGLEFSWAQDTCLASDGTDAVANSNFSNNIIHHCGQRGITFENDQGAFYIQGTHLYEIGKAPIFEQCEGVGAGCMASNSKTAAAIYVNNFGAPDTSQRGVIKGNTIHDVGGGRAGHSYGIQLNGYNIYEFIDANLIYNSTASPSGFRAIALTGTLFTAEYQHLITMRNNRCEATDICLLLSRGDTSVSQAGKANSFLGNTCLNPGIVCYRQELGAAIGGTLSFRNNIAAKYDGYVKLIDVPSSTIWSGAFTNNAVECSDAACAGQTIATVQGTNYQREGSCTPGTNCIEAIGSGNIYGALAVEAGTLYIGDGSEAIDAGVNLGNLITDVVGRARPSGAATDIGAYEYPQGTAGIAQDAFRFYQSNQVQGTNPLAAENVDIVTHIAAGYTIRFGIIGASGPTSIPFKPYAQLCNPSCGSWVAVTTTCAGTPACLVDSPGRPFEEQLTTSGITLDTRTLAADSRFIDEGTFNARSFDVNEQLEMEYSLKHGGSVAVGDVVKIRLHDGTLAFGTYTETPEITVAGPKGDIQGGNF